MLFYSLIIALCFSQANISPMQVAALTGEYEMPEAEDIVEMGMLAPALTGGVGGVGGVGGTGMFSQWPAAACLDNDACKAWMTMQALNPTTNTGSTNGTTTVNTGASAASNAYSAYTGLPAGFNPAMYGLDPDAQLKDCADEVSCMQGLTMFNAQNGITMPMLPFLPNAVVLQRPRYHRPQYRLSTPRYNSRSTYGVPHYYGYQPVYYVPSYYHY